MPPPARTYTYEAMFLIGQAAAADLASSIEHIKEILGRGHAELIAMRKWDERRLAFEIDKQKRGAIYKEAETAMLEDMPILPCFCSNIHNLMSKKVRGFEQLPFSNWGDQFANLTIS